MSSAFSSNPTSDLSWWLADDEEKDPENTFGRSEENEKDCTIFVVDAEPEMFSEIKNDDEAVTWFNETCGAITNCLKRKIIKSSDDLVGVILFNTRETQNSMNHNNIYLLVEPDRPSAQTIKRVRDLPADFDDIGSLGKGKQSDFRDLLWTLQNLFSEVDVAGTKYGSKRVFIFTMNDNPLRRDNEATIAKSQDMLDSGIEITVFPLKSADHGFTVSNFYAKVCSLDLDELTGEGLLKDACPSLHDLEEDLRVKEMKKRSLVSCPFTLMDDVHLAVKMYCVTRKATKETPTWLDARNNQPLVTETNWVCKDTGAVLDDLSIVTYQEYSPAKMRVYFTRDEMKELKRFGKPSLRLMGFKPLDRLKPYYNIKPAYFMYPDETRIEGSTLAFNALLQAMLSEERFAVARFIFREASGPRFVALVAQKEQLDDHGEQEAPPGFHVIFMPYADDIRKIEMKKAARASDEVVVKSKAVVSRLAIKEIFTPANPVLQRHYDALEAIALEEDILEPIDEIEPNSERMLDVAKDEIDALKQVYPAGSAPPKKKPYAGRKRRNENADAGGKKPKARRRAKNENASAAAVLDWKALAQNDELKSLKVADLKVYLDEHGLSKSGRKAVLIERIKNHLGV